MAACSAATVESATEVQINEAETAMGVMWPESYRQFALTCGAVYAPSLLDLIVGLNAAITDVQDFFTPKQSVTATRRSLMEPLRSCIVFANDCSGNVFGFRILPVSIRVDDAPVWLFDYENDSVSMESHSFDEWISRFLEL